MPVVKPTIFHMAINTKTAKSLGIELPPDYSASLTRSSNSKASLNCPGIRLWPKSEMPKNAIDVAIEGKADMTCCAAYVCF